MFNNSSQLVARAVAAGVHVPWLCQCILPSLADNLTLETHFFDRCRLSEVPKRVFHAKSLYILEVRGRSVCNYMETVQADSCCLSTSVTST